MGGSAYEAEVPQNLWPRRTLPLVDVVEVGSRYSDFGSEFGWRPVALLPLQECDELPIGHAK